MTFAKITFRSACEDDVIEDRVISHLNALNSLTTVLDNHDVVVFCEGRWPESLPVDRPKIKFERVDSLPDSASVVEDYPSWPEHRSEELTKLYFNVLDKIVDPALDIAKDQAKKIGKGVRLFDAAFKLGQALKALDPDDVDPQPYQQAVQVFCHLQGRDFGEFWDSQGGFLDGFPRIKIAKGERDIEVLLDLAERQPYPCDRKGMSSDYEKVVSVAYHLSCLSEDRVFQLPNIVKPWALTRYKDAMTEAGFIACVDANYAFGHKDRKKNYKKKYKWVGDDL